MRYCAGAKPSSADFSYHLAAWPHVGLDAAAFGIAGADLEQRLGVAGVGRFAQRQRAGIIGH